MPQNGQRYGISACTGMHSRAMTEWERRVGCRSDRAVRPLKSGNGLVVAKGEEVGIPDPTHAALTEVVQRIERGKIDAHPRNVASL
jgi:hypothetical protein